jgi:hypothetical protein
LIHAERGPEGADVIATRSEIAGVAVDAEDRAVVLDDHRIVLDARHE